MERRSENSKPASPERDLTKGILHPVAIDRKFAFSRHAPSEELAYFIEHYWIVSWDLRGKEPYISETLPFPSVHVVIEKGKSGVLGVVTGRFTRLLENEGRVFGIKFRPGAFRPFIKEPVSSLTGHSFAIAGVFGKNGEEFERSMLAADDEAKMVAVAEAFIRSCKPVRDENIPAVNRIVGTLIAGRGITKVDDVVSLTGINKRNLQRLFNEYVGVSPKWVVMRYRVQEAADRLAGGEYVDLPRLALEMGYFDQAHFIRDFKSIVGLSPGEYARNARSFG